MRFVLAIVSFVCAAVLIGYGIAERTLFAEPDRVNQSISVPTDASVTVIDGAALNAFDGSQTLTVDGGDTIFAAYGRTSDVLGWVGDTRHNRVTFDIGAGELTSRVVSGTQTEVPDAQGSDLWLDDYTEEDALRVTVNVPEDISFLVMSDGIAPAPARLALSWPLDNSAPWSVPTIAIGTAFLILGLALLLWAAHHMRRSRGPRRKSQKMPKVPRKPNYKPTRRAIGRPVAGRRSITNGMAAIPLLLVPALLAGCSADVFVTDDADTRAPAATISSAAAPAEVLFAPPAVTVRQVERILAKIRTAAADADAAKDGTLLATRFTGAALELRLANYAIQAVDAATPPLPPIPDGPIEVILPEQTDAWPRTVFVVVKEKGDSTSPPMAIFLDQADARSNYLVSYAMTLEPSKVIPDVAPASIGAARFDPAGPLLRFTPDEVALAYASILEADAESEAFADFEAEEDTLRAAVGLAKKQEMRAALPATASMVFAHALGPAAPIALATVDGGAIIAVNLYETTTVAPIEAGAAVNPTGQVKALSGLAISTKAVVATYGDQLLFYVPAPTGDGKIILLGYSQGLVKAGEI